MRRARRAQIPAVVALGLVAVVQALVAGPPAAAATAQRASSTAAGPAGPSLTLVETRPLETALGDSTLPAAQGVWLDMIGRAHKTLDLEEFYLSEEPGKALTPVLDAIGQAAARGVKVRLLLDAGMHRTYPMPADSLGRLPNVSLRLIDYKRLAGGVQHAKYFVVDGAESYVGSQNLDWRSLSHIHELGFRVASPAVAAALEDVFETDWTDADTTGAAPRVVDRARLSLPLAFRQDGADGQLWLSASPRKLTPASLPWDHDILVERLRGAKHEICLQTLTYGVSGYGLTDSTLHRELLAAAARGVKVKLLVSDWVLGGRGEQALKALAATPNIEVRISRLPEWSGGYISYARVEHCKFLVVDSEWLWVGTSNWEPGYFLNTRNVAITVHHVPLAREARRVFENDWTGPTALAFTPETLIAPRPHGEKP